MTAKWTGRQCTGRQEHDASFDDVGVGTVTLSEHNEA